jgi:TolB-like protein
MNSNRRLAAIVFADISGYTAIMQQDEIQALQILSHFRSDVENYVPKFGGKVVQFYGDGCLLTFKSAIGAVQCAVQLQHTLRDEPYVPVRIGIHQGDIVEEGGNIFGNAVNLAARIESMGIPGAILLSAKVKSEIQNQTSISVQSLGLFKFKNVEQAIEVYAYSSEGFPVPNKNEIKGKFKIQNEEKSIAVLAFENRSSDVEQEYFAEGVAEEIMYGLSKIDNLKVAGRASSFSYKNSDLALQKIAEQLKVEMLLCGNVRKMGQKIRVTAELVNGFDGFQVWTERYDRELEDVFAIQEEIAGHVVHEMKLHVLGKDSSKPLIQRKTENIEAYQLYLQGKSYLDHRRNISAALSCFDKAIELDANFGAAYNSKAYGHVYSIMFANISPLIAFPKAEAAIQKALEINPENPESYSIRSWIQFYYHMDIKGAMEGFEKAILLQPRFSDTFRIKAYMHSMIGQTERAVFCAEKAFELEPMSFNISFSLGDIYRRAHYFDKALQVLTDLEEKYPDSRIVKETLGIVYFSIGKKEKARAIFKGKFNISDAPNLYSYTKILFAVLENNQKRLKKYLDTLEQAATDKWVHPIFFSILHYYLEHEEKAQEYFENSIIDKDPTLIQIYNDDILLDYLKLPYISEFYKNTELPDSQLDT